MFPNTEDCSYSPHWRLMDIHHSLFNYYSFLETVSVAEASLKKTLCIWPLTSAPLTSPSRVQSSQICNSTPGFCRAGDGTQGFTHARKVGKKSVNILPLGNFLYFEVNFETEDNYSIVKKKIYVYAQLLLNDLHHCPPTWHTGRANTPDEGQSPEDRAGSSTW